MNELENYQLVDIPEKQLQFVIKKVLTKYKKKPTVYT